jgi:hypothetical protein
LAVSALLAATLALSACNGPLDTGTQRAAATAVGALCATPESCPGATALIPYNPTHYAVQAEQVVVLKIVDASDAVVVPCGTSEGVPVWVKSSHFGNLEFCGTLADGTVTVTVVIPAAPAPGVAACSTTVVAYGALGNNANNSIIAAIVGRTSGGSAAGLAIVDAEGHVVDCESPNPCAGVVCDDGNPCTYDHCVDGACVFDAAPMEDVLCRLPNGVCDTAEYCLGGQCPADGYLPPTVLCREAQGVCDAPDYCTGDSPDCSADAKLPATEVCRPSATVCDKPELCDGVGNDCPADEFWPANTDCTGDGDYCTRDVCDGAGTCIHPAKLCVTKFFDGDTDGLRDGVPLEQSISGWQIAVTPLGGGSTALFTTGANGEAPIFMAPGAYEVCELTGGWIATVPTCFVVTFAGDFPYEPDVTRHEFGNVCLGAGGGRTLGFWSNRNGQRIFTATDLGKMGELNLRDANGKAFDPASYTAFRTWLLGANATNMAYMLSAQFAAIYLNASHGFIDPYALIYAPGVASANALGFATIWDVAVEANATLAAAGLTLAGSPARAYQTALKDALDRANNNLNFVQHTPATCPAPQF